VRFETNPVSPTPILDREQPLPSVAKVLWRWRLLGAAIGGVLVSALIVLDQNGWIDVDNALPPYALPAFLLAFYLAVLVHEMGHVIAGRLTGFGLRHLAVGAFLLDKETHGWRFRFLPRRIIAGGLTGMMPRSPDNLEARYIRAVLGGPAGSMLLLLVTLAVPGGFPTRVLLFVNLFVLILSCIPYTVGSQPNDAKIILTLALKRTVGERLAAIPYLLALDAQGTQPRDWPHGFVAKLSIPTKDQSHMTASLAFQYAEVLESNNPELIGAVLERALAFSPKMSADARRAFFLEASWFQGMLRNNAPLAEAWLDCARKVKNAVFQKDWDSKALAAISCAKGRYAEASELLTRYVALLDRKPASGMIAAEQARTVDLQSRLAAQPA